MHGKNNTNTRGVQYHTSDILKKFTNTTPAITPPSPKAYKGHIYDNAAMHTNPPIAMDSKAMRLSAANEVWMNAQTRDNGVVTILSEHSGLLRLQYLYS